MVGCARRNLTWPCTHARRVSPSRCSKPVWVDCWWFSRQESGAVIPNRRDLACLGTILVVRGARQDSDVTPVVVMLAHPHAWSGIWASLTLGRLAETRWTLGVHGMRPPRSVPVLSLFGGSRPTMAPIRLVGRNDETSSHAASPECRCSRGFNHQVPYPFSHYMVVRRLVCSARSNYGINEASRKAADLSRTPQNTPRTVLGRHMSMPG
jgi:hypothetical protein